MEHITKWEKLYAVSVQCGCRLVNDKQPLSHHSLLIFSQFTFRGLSCIILHFACCSEYCQHIHPVPKLLLTMLEQNTLEGKAKSCKMSRYTEFFCYFTRCCLPDLQVLWQRLHPGQVLHLWRSLWSPSDRPARGSSKRRYEGTSRETSTSLGGHRNFSVKMV